MQPYSTLLLLVILFGFSPGVVAESKLRSFTTDGCSAFPDGSREDKQLWLTCCTRHDLAYWQGGTRTERRSADRALQACVAEVGKPALAKLMLAGVRVGGTPYLPTRFRWGYGWPYFRGYKALSPEEQQRVSELLEDVRQLEDLNQHRNQN